MLHKRVHLIVWSAVFLTFTTVENADATVVRAAPDRELGAMASEIVLGRVISLKTEVTSRGQVVTRVYAETIRTFKGDRAPLEGFRFTIPGGTLPDGRVVKVSGTPPVSKDQVFLASLETRNGVMRPLGLSLGYWTARPDGQGSWLLSRNIKGIRLVGSGGGAVNPILYSVQSDSLDAVVARLWPEGSAGPTSEPNVAGGTVQP